MKSIGGDVMALPPQKTMDEILAMATSGNADALSYANAWSPLLSAEDRADFFQQISARLAAATESA